MHRVVPLYLTGIRPPPHIPYGLRRLVGLYLETHGLTGVTARLGELLVRIDQRAVRQGEMPSDLATKIDETHQQLAALQSKSASTREIKSTRLRLIALKRQLRDGGQLKAGDILAGQYCLEAKVGNGGFGTVWRAYDRDRRRTVAVKVLHAQWADSKDRRDRFFRGARQMERLKHPNIVQVLDVKGEDGGFHFFVMEYIEGGNLFEAVTSGRIVPGDIVPIILEVGRALHYAHTHEVIHRDVKPSNILLDYTGQGKLTDFDLVQAADTTGGTRTGALGTFIYSAPEVLDSAKNASPKSDLFSLGMTILFGLRGEELPLTIFRDPEQAVKVLPCDDTLRNVLLHTVTWDPQERFSSVEDFCAALDVQRLWQEDFCAALDVQRLWQDVLEVLRKHVEAPKYATWFEPLKPLSSAAGMLRIAVPNKFVRDWLVQHYHDLITETLQECTGVPYQVFFVLLEPIEMWPFSQPLPNTKQTFNPRFTFETFVVGSSNKFAHAACQAIARHPARTYNPLFIYGAAGIGKTHLLYAIDHYVQQTHRNMKTCYVSCDKFENDLISALGQDKVNEFHNYYRQNDVILIDDVQSLIRQERLQEAFFHTFNVLFNDNKQIVLTSGKSPQDMIGLEERLRKRFEWGLVADLQAPDLETKIAILTRKAEFMQMTLPDEVAWFLARQLRGDIRKLEGALNVIEAFTSMTGQQITVSLVQNLIAELADVQEERPISIADIERAVADRYKLKGALLRSKKRNKEIVHARHVAMYLARTLTAASLLQIGHSFGYRDATSVLHAYNKIKGIVEDDWRFKEEIEQLIRVLEEPED